MLDLSKHYGWHSRATLAADLDRIGLGPGDLVMVHAAMRSVGRIQGGVDAFIDAALAVVGRSGTIMVYTDWNADYVHLADKSGDVPKHLHQHVAPFNADTSRASRDNGVLPEWVRSRPGSHRSANPGASVAALGRLARDLTVNHSFSYGYGPDSPLARLVALGGKVLMVGAPWDTMTLLHHAEDRARVSPKKTVSGVVPIASAGGMEWTSFEEFDTEDPILEQFDEDYFAEIVSDYVQAQQVMVSAIGEANSLLVSAPHIIQHATTWIESHSTGI